MASPKSAPRQPLTFIGSSQSDLRGFTPDARGEAGHELDRVQRGLMPTDFKPMHTVGSGAYEIRVRDEGNQYRVVYVAKFESGVYVLHAFQKTTRKTEQKDIDLARRRYRTAKADDDALQSRRRGGR